MKRSRYYPFWMLGMAVIAGVLMAFAFINITGAPLPDSVIRTLGIMEMTGVVTVVYTTVKMKAEVKNTYSNTKKKKKK
ncbi:MAG: hypothetical protein IKJ05_05545 [Oscillospiraceae bacterium]|nr:hypothetical protein [Oscillospiraceae bacterium]